MNRNEKIEYIKNQSSLLQNFICPDFPDLGIYSGQYSREILFNIYSNCKEKKDFCYTYIDFDKLSVVNEVHGKEIGDIALYSALKIIKSYLPKDALFGRLGGDEFYIITPNKTKLDVDKLYNKINTALRYYSSKVYGLTVTLATESSLKSRDTEVDTYKTLEQISKLAERRVLTQKHKNKQEPEEIFSDFFIELPVPQDISDEQSENWETLNLSISASIKNHLRDLRPSKEFRYKLEHINLEALSIVTALKDIIELRIKDKKHNKPQSSFSITQDNAQLIHNIFSNSLDFKSLSDEKISALKSSMDSLSESLLRDCNSKLFSKSYYNLYLANSLEKSNQSYQAVYFSISGIRPSNTANGHDYTDARIQETAKKIIEAVSTKRNFNNQAFSFTETDNFLIDQAGGNYILFLPMENALTEEEINNIVTVVNSTSDITQSNSTFMIASAFENDINTTTIPDLLNTQEKVSNKKLFVKYARHLKGICNRSKDDLKEKILVGVDNMVAFRKSMANCANFFVEHIDDSDNIQTKKFFLTNVFTSLVNHESFFNKELDNEKKEQDSSLDL